MFKLIVVINRSFVRKIVWIEFGGDLYNENTKASVISVIHSHLNAYIANHCKAIVCIFPPDCDYFLSKFPMSNAKVFYAPYCGSQIPDYILDARQGVPLSHRYKDNNPIIIQVGHNGSDTLNHINVLNQLSKYRDQNIRILLVLSYGCTYDYAKKVRIHAESLFPDKTICLNKILTIEEYYTIIDTVDICIFNTFRQCGLGNIDKMIWNGVKLYMPENSVMYKYFISQGIPIQKYEDIQEQTFEAFCSFTDSVNNAKYCFYKQKQSSINWRIDHWREVYEWLRKEKINEVKPELKNQ